MEVDGDGATRSLQVTPVPGGGAQHFALTPRSLARDLRERKSDPGSPSTSPRTGERTEILIFGGSPRRVVLPSRNATSPSTPSDGERAMKSPRVSERRGTSAVAQEMEALPELSGAPVSSDASWQQVSVQSSGRGGHGLKDAKSTRLHDGGSGEASHSNPGTSRTEDTGNPERHGGGRSSSEAQPVDVQDFEESGRVCAAVVHGKRCTLKGEELLQIEGSIRQLRLTFPGGNTFYCSVHAFQGCQALKNRMVNGVMPGERDEALIALRALQRARDIEEGDVTNSRLRMEMERIEGLLTQGAVELSTHDAQRSEECKRLLAQMGEHAQAHVSGVETAAVQWCSRMSAFADEEHGRQMKEQQKVAEDLVDKERKLMQEQIESERQRLEQQFRTAQAILGER